MDSSDNFCTAYPLEYGKRAAREPLSQRDLASIYGSADVHTQGNMPTMTYDRKPRGKYAVAPSGLPDRFHRACHSVAIHLPARVGKSDIDWFHADWSNFGPGSAGARRPTPRRILFAHRYVETSHPQPASGQQSGTIAGLFLAPRWTDYPQGASSVRRENLLKFAPVALIRRFATRGGPSSP
jgi:hypothetical protein